jgi:hypothetical protein
LLDELHGRGGGNNDYVSQLNALSEKVEQQGALLQEILTAIKDIRVSSSRRPATLKEIRHQALGDTSQLQHPHQQQQPLESQQLFQELYAPRDRLVELVKTAQTMNDAMNLITDSISKVKYPFSFDENTGNIVDSSTKHVYGDIRKTSSLLFEVMIKRTLEIVDSIRPTLDDDQRKLWTVIVDSKADPDAAFPLLCTNAISRHITTLVCQIDDVVSDK